MGVWAEVSETTFDRYMELFEVDESSEPLHSSSLANALRPYRHLFGVEVEISFMTSSERPTLHVNYDKQSQLAEEQRNGIDDARHHEILDLSEEKT